MRTAIGRWFRRRRWRFGWAIAALTAVLFSAVVPLPLASVVVRMQGSNTIGSQLAPDLVLGFLRSRTSDGATLGIGQAVPGNGAGTIGQGPSGPQQERSLQFEINAPGSERAFECGIDIGMSSFPIDTPQLAPTEVCNDDVEGVAIAADAVAVIAHPGVGLTTISLENLRSIFRCGITDWKDLGLAPGRITVLRRDDFSGTAEVFQQRVLGDDAFCSDAAQYEDSEELAERVAQTPGAIGFVGLPFVGENSVPAVSDTDSVTAVAPTEENVRSGTYPLSRDLFLYVDPSPQPVVDEFLSFVRSCAGQRIVEENGFFRGAFLACEELPSSPVDGPTPAIPLTPCPPDGPPEYCSFVADATQLPFVVRYDVAAGQVDEAGRADLEQLAVYVETLGPGVQIVLAGFTDSVGTPASNLVLSRQRAQEATAVLRGRNAEFDIAVEGFGASLPVGDNATDAGRERNRRVEAWIRIPG